MEVKVEVKAEVKAEVKSEVESEVEVITLSDCRSEKSVTGREIKPGLDTFDILREKKDLVIV